MVTRSYKYFDGTSELHKQHIACNISAVLMYASSCPDIRFLGICEYSEFIQT